MPKYLVTDLNDSGSDCYEKTANWLSRLITGNPSLNGKVQAKATSTREVPTYRQKMVIPFISSKVKPDVSVVDEDDSISSPTDEGDLANQPTDEECLM